MDIVINHMKNDLRNGQILAAKPESKNEKIYICNVWWPYINFTMIERLNANV